MVRQYQAANGNVRIHVAAPLPAGAGHASAGTMAGAAFFRAGTTANVTDPTPGDSLISLASPTGRASYLQANWAWAKGTAVTVDVRLKMLDNGQADNTFLARRDLSHKSPLTRPAATSASNPATIRCTASIVIPVRNRLPTSAPATAAAMAVPRSGQSSCRHSVATWPA
jgi:hypothetical protein